MGDEAPMVDAPKMSKRDELSQAVKAELMERGRRCMARIEVILKEENCLLTAEIHFEEAAPGKWVTVCNPGVKAL